MESKLLNILAIGRNADIMQVMQRLINVPDKWKGTAVITNEEAIAVAGKGSFDLTLLCAGISEEDEAKLKEDLKQLAPEMVIIRHYGGGSGLLENEIQGVLNENKRAIPTEV